jgi:uncharacterized protein YdeI (YjbR/CyaY-like superfamily)
MPDKIHFYRNAAAFRRWLMNHHDTESERVVGLYRKETGKGGITYPEALDEALCFGWIDGVRRSLGDGRFTIRFSPRKKGSVWSLVNVRHVQRLLAEGRMQPAGIAAFEARTPDKTGTYSFERKSARFAPAHEAQFRRRKRAWTFWLEQPPGYRHTATHWVESAKQEATRLRRLGLLIEDSAAGLRLAMLTGKKREG